MSAMLQWLRESVAKDGAEEIRRQWLETTKEVIQSPNAIEYLESLNQGWIILDPEWCTRGYPKLLNLMTSEFPGSFFRNLAV